MSSLLFSSDLLAQDDPTRLASRSQAERRIVDRGRVFAPTAAITPSDDAPRAGSEPAAVVVSRTGQTPNVVLVLSNPRVGLDQSPFGRAPGHRAVIDPTRTTTHFASASASAASAPQGSAAANPALIPATPAAGDAPVDTGIRPMMLAPSAPTVWGGGHFFAADESGGGDPPPDKPPLLEASGGTAEMGSWAAQPLRDGNNQPIAGMYEIPQGVPVGTVMQIRVTSPAQDYVITDVLWSGGTDISGYLSADPSTEVFGDQGIDHNVATTTSYYIFVVDADVRQYTVTTHVQYNVNGGFAQGDSTVTFTSARPNGSLSVKQVGTQTFSTEFNPGRATVMLSPEIQFEATASTGQYTGGDFMFMQVVNTIDRSYTTDINQSFHFRNDGK